MTLSNKREVVGGCVFFIFAATYYVMALSIKQYHDGFLSSDFIPKVYGLILMLLSALQVLFGVWKNQGHGTVEAKAAGRPLFSRLRPIILTFILLLGYVLLLEPIGFVIMSSAFIFLMTLMLYPKNERHAKQMLQVFAVACVFSGLIYFLFVRGFALTLPVGILG